MASKLDIHGDPQCKLIGSVAISGAKNAALPMMAATLLTTEVMHLKNIPHLKDITTMCQLLTQLGVSLLLDDDMGLEAKAEVLSTNQAPYDLVRTMRASFLLLGPLLARLGSAEVSLPGGCAIGSRPVELHLSALRALGADIDVQNGYVCASAPDGLIGAEITFPHVTVTGTENIVMAACLAKGVTTIYQAAIEPEVSDLIVCLRKMGAKIEGEGTSTLTITGVERLSGCTHDIMPDRIEAGTFLVAGAMSRGRVTVEGIQPTLMEALLDALRECGAEVTSDETSVTVDMKGKRPKAVSVQTAPYPGFPTDMQAQWMVLNAVAEGEAEVEENVFENRFMHVQELARMGADISLSGHKAFVRGRESLSAAEVTATDLRASACLVLAGIVAIGKTEVHRVYHIDRGYEHIEDKLRQLGVSIQRVLT